jgi:TonB family protein
VLHLAYEDGMSLTQQPAAHLAAAESISAAVALLPHAPTSRARRTALIASLLLHAALLAWVVLYFTAKPYGAGGIQLEGIAIELTSSTALDSLIKAAQPAGGDTAAPSESAGQPTSQHSPQPALAPSLEASTTPVIITAPVAETVMPETPPDPKAVTDDKPHIASTPPAQAAFSPPTETGGSTSEAAIPSANSSASAGAALGEAQRYALDVRRVLSRNRPKANWPSGSLNLAFTISDRGDVSKAEVLKPSGNTQLDQRALAWIGAARFPLPPAGLTLAQRTYAIPVTVERKAQ